MPTPHYFGAHTIDNGGVAMAARRAGASGMRALQVFSAIPKYYVCKKGTLTKLCCIRSLGGVHLSAVRDRK